MCVLYLNSLSDSVSYNIILYEQKKNAFMTTVVVRYAGEKVQLPLENGFTKP